MKTRKAVVVLMGVAALLTAGCATDAGTAGRNTSASGRLPVYSPERQSAATFVGMLNFYVQRMGQICAPVLDSMQTGGAETSANAVVEEWRARNKPYSAAAARYVVDLAKEVTDTRGQDAGAKVRASYERQVEASGQTLVARELQQAGGKAQGCREFAASVRRGKYDIREDSPHYSTLKVLVADYGS